MDNSRRSVAPGEDSISMYLSFDADDTLASKWQSVMTTQTSQYLEMQSMEVNLMHNDTLDEKKKDMKTVLDALIKNDSTKDQSSPLRPFDKSILNKHNALCSTPTKNITLSEVRQNDVSDNKENTQPDDQNSTLSSTIDATATTVKTNTMFNEANVTLDEISVKESSNKTSIYPLSADVVLENITEVSNEEPSITMPSPTSLPIAVVAQEKKDTDTVVSDMVNEVSELIAKAMKLTESSVKPKEQPKLPTLAALPRPRRSYLPTVNGTTFKQRMSIVVKTTLNSPARKLATQSNSNVRRSCVPTARPSLIGNTAQRKSMLPRSAESKNAKPGTLQSLPATVKGASAKPRLIHQFKCQFCTFSFRDQAALDTHMDSHWKFRPATRNKNSFFCKYCDKQFVLERALHIHLMQNCDKIPPSEKRKLQFTELNHVKKAMLPKLTGSSLAVNGDNFRPRESSMPETAKTPAVAKLKSWSSSKTVTEVTSALVATNSETTAKSMHMAPPSLKKVPKKVAHAGVYRTPTKSVPCHVCKQSFKSILDYTTHCLTVHSKNQKQNSANAPSAQDQD